jgi:hypothetical protein
LSDLALPNVQLAPLFRALNRQHTLQELHIAGNCFGDDGVKVWAFGKRGGTLTNVSFMSLVFSTFIKLAKKIPCCC